MILSRIQLTNFKNIAEAQLTLSPKLNCFLGNNGMGKSNMMDAIHYLSFCKSFTGAPDKLLVRRGEQFALLKAHYLRRGSDEEVSIGFAEGRRKSVRRGGKEYRRITEHIGNFPSVLIAPSDMDLVNGSGEDRRRFIDMAISQGDVRYLDMLVRYNAALTQRNSMLRSQQYTDSALYAAVETVMDSAATYITAKRRAFIDRLRDIHARYYRAIAGDSAAEETGLAYADALSGDTAAGISGLDASGPGWLSTLFEASRERDTLLRHTTVGPHRDDIVFTLDGMPLRRTGSQGQQKTFTIALRLAQYEFLSKITGLKPLLLLDDIFDKLDARRVEAIIAVVAGDTFGQIFITDTNRRHLDDIVTHMPHEHALWLVDNGIFTPLADS